MLSLPPAVRIFVATAPTNMHLSFDRLAALARDELAQDLRASVHRERSDRPNVNTGIGPW
jgi:hypothetical protein